MWGFGGRADASTHGRGTAAQTRRKAGSGALPRTVGHRVCEGRWGGLRLRPTMTDDLRWAVRYAFLEDLWRDRNRVIVDAGFEAALRSSGPDTTDDPLEELVDGLAPRVPKSRTWMAVADESVARQLAQTRPGTGFLPRGNFADVVAHRDWAVALVELAALDDATPGGTRLREQLSERARDGRTVLVSTRAATDEHGEDPGFAALGELLDESLGGGRIFGVYRPPMAAVVDFGGDDEGEDDEVPLSFDNTLGTQAPEFIEYVAVAGEHPPLPEGMTLVELPSDTPAVSAGDEALRDQLLQAQRQAELAAIDRQALLEKVDQLESAREQGERQASELRDQLARAVTEPGSSEAGDELQATQADNQALRWKVQQLQRELDAVRARPVEVLEAEVAALRAELAARTPAPVEADQEEPSTDEVSSEEAKVEAVESAVSSGDDPPSPEHEAGSSEESGSGEEPAESPAGVELDRLMESDAEERLDGHYIDAVDDAERLRFGEALAQLDRLIAQVERGGIGVLPLRQALVSLRKRLRS